MHRAHRVYLKLAAVLSACALAQAGFADVTAHIAGVGVSEKDGEQFYDIKGTAAANQFKRAWLVIGQGEQPAAWKRVGTKLKKPVADGTLTSINAKAFAELGLWQIELHVEDATGEVATFRKPLRLK